MESLPNPDLPVHPAAPFAVPLKLSVLALNDEAGRHPLPDDPRELEAALRAGERSWQRFPYYGLRYGERGRRFTRSDSGWLATLVSQDQPAVDREISWLGVVLASRGMPRWLLETHLDVLAEELARAAPEQATKYAPLRLAAAMLAGERRRHVTDELLGKLTAAFDERAGAEWTARLPESGGLIAAAIADERRGIERAVSSLVDWLGAEERFPRQWVEAVRWTVGEARAIAA